MRVDGDTGYVNRLLRQPSTRRCRPTRRAYMGTVVNCNESVNVRAAASASSKRLGTAPKGSVWTVTEAYCAGGWHRIDYQGQPAYIFWRVSLARRRAGGTTGSSPRSR